MYLLTAVRDKDVCYIWQQGIHNVCVMNIEANVVHKIATVYFDSTLRLYLFIFNFVFLFLAVKLVSFQKFFSLMITSMITRCQLVNTFYNLFL